MHELSICRAISDIAERHANGQRVSSVCIDVGGLRQVVPGTLAYCWRIVVDGTPLEGSVLDITEIPPTIECAGCGQRTVLEDPVFRCAGCAGSDVTIAAGNELTITSLELQEA
jgi:hydrogenase nickel incorporation protein HypA/HybF